MATSVNFMTANDIDWGSLYDTIKGGGTPATAQKSSGVWSPIY